MKKILIVLIFSFSYSFSSCTDTYLPNVAVGDCYNGHIITLVTDGNTGVNSGKTISWVNSHCSGTTGTTGGYVFKEVNFQDISGGYGYCTYQTIFYSPSSTCEVTPTCTESDSQNEDCSCKSGYIPLYDDGGNQEGCTPDCSDFSVENPNPDEWIDLGISDADLCTAFLSNRQINGTFLSSSNDMGCSDSRCFGQEVSPCDNLDNPLDFLKSGYIYKGKVSAIPYCSSYVYAGSQFIDSYTHKADSNCDLNTDLYCYVLPLNGDNNESNESFSNLPDVDENNEVPNFDYNLPLDENNDLSDKQNLNNQILQDLKVNLQDQTLDIKDYHSWFKNKFGKWEPADFHTDNTNVVSAINSQNSNLGGKLDTINNSIKDLNLTVINENNISNDANFTADFNATNELLQQILDGNSTEDANTSGITSYLNDTYLNFKTQYDNVETQINDAIAIVNGKDLSSVLNTNSISSCPKSFTFDISSSISKDFVIDPCVVLSQSREYMYTFSYISFSAMFISFLVGMIVKV